MIRNARVSDLPALVEIYNHYVRETPITFDIEETTIEARQAWFSQFDANSPLSIDRLRGRQANCWLRAFYGVSSQTGLSSVC